MRHKNEYTIKWYVMNSWYGCSPSIKWLKINECSAQSTINIPKAKKNISHSCKRTSDGFEWEKGRKRETKRRRVKNYALGKNEEGTSRNREQAREKTLRIKTKTIMMYYNKNNNNLYLKRRWNSICVLLWVLMAIRVHS